MTDIVFLSNEQKDTCPVCGEPVYSRERCPDGVSWCANGHAWRVNMKLTKERLADGRIHTTKGEQYIERVPSRDR